MRKFVVKVNGNEYEVEIDEVGGVSSPSVQAAKSVSAPVQVPQKQEVKQEVVSTQPKVEAPKQASTQVNTNGTKLESPLPGVVLKFVASEGSVVKSNDVVLIIEAMKLENEIRANADGVIHFAVATGALVESGQVIAYIG